MTPADPQPEEPTAAPRRWRRCVDTGWRATPLGLVLLPAGQADPVTVAGSAVAVWELLAEPTTRRNMAEVLSRRYSTDVAAVDADLEPLLARLFELGAIEPASPRSSYLS